MYNNVEIAEKALVRANQISNSKKRRRRQCLSALALVCCFVALSVFSLIFSSGFNEPEQHVRLDDLPIPLADFPASDTNNSQVYLIPGFSSITIQAGTQFVKLPLVNPAENPYMLKFEIILKDTGEIIYTSDFIKPAEEIGSVKLSKPLESGQHEALLNIQAVSPETLTLQSRASVEFTVIANG